MHIGISSYRIPTGQKKIILNRYRQWSINCSQCFCSRDLLPWTAYPRVHHGSSGIELEPEEDHELGINRVLIRQFLGM